MTSLYFAYGSNMLSSQIMKRVPSVKVIGIAALHDWCVNFSKKSIDGSGKANLLQKTGFITWGVLYEIEKDGISELDEIEKGYRRITIRVIKNNSETTEAQTYISDNLIDKPVALDFYKQKVISGAIEHKLPEEYILYLQQLPSRIPKAT